MVKINQLKDIINEAINIRNFGLHEKNKEKLIILELKMNNKIKEII